MYEIDDLDRVVVVDTLPRSSIGAPRPVVLSDEQTTVVAYYAQETPPDRDGTSAHTVELGGADEPVVLVQLSRCYATIFGPPNDESFDGHPLAARGLDPYGAFLVESSSWIRQLARMNSVHPDHVDSAFEAYRHLVLSFHDSTFEAVCMDFGVTHARGSIARIMPQMVSLLGRPAR